MLNIDLKNQAISRLESANDKYESHRSTVMELSEALYKFRKKTSEGLVAKTETYVNSLANTPKAFDRTFSAYRAEFKLFNSIILDLQKEAAATSVKAGSSAAAGVAAGVGTAAFAPTAAVAVATTFGTASTGTAISALSGAAASKAALAWLGGGALTAGGGGVAAGKALLALAGPVGWAIGGAALAGSGIYARSRNQKIAEQADTSRRTLETHIATFQAATKEVDRLLKLTRHHAAGTSRILEQLKKEAPSNYLDFGPEHKELIGSLVNHIQALSKLLNKKVAVK